MDEDEDKDGKKTRMWMKDRDEEEEDEEQDEDGKKMEGQLGLTDASCQRPWREQTPAAGERAMTSISLMSPSIIF